MRLVALLMRGFIFFTLFAFALNNQQAATVHLFFGAQWHAPMVIVVLVAFAAGCAVGVVAMLPGWWKRRREARRRQPAPTGTEPGMAPGGGSSSAAATGAAAGSSSASSSLGAPMTRPLPPEAHGV